MVSWRCRAFTLMRTDWTVLIGTRPCGEISPIMIKDGVDDDRK